MVVTCRAPDGLESALFEVDGRPLTPGPSLAVVNHSPTGFAWGYGGSGPTQLALAILMEVGLPPRRALLHYHDFRTEFITPLDFHAKEWRLEIDLEEWLAPREQPCAGCEGHGFQSGAHTEYVHDCPFCGGSGTELVREVAA